MQRRFFVERPIQSTQIALSGSEAHHLTGVLRAAVGDEVVLFDGSGDEFTARVEHLRRREVDLRILTRRAVDRELPCSLTLAVALPKGDRQRWLVEKAVELGVSELVPLVTRRGVAQPVRQALQRLRRAVIESSKQCGRNRLMTIGPARAWTDYAATAPPQALCLLAHPDRSARRTPLRAVAVPAERGAEIRAAVGPEGGFTAEEVEHGERGGWQPIHLGQRTLRVETATVMLAAWIAAQTAR